MQNNESKGEWSVVVYGRKECNIQELTECAQKLLGDKGREITGMLFIAAIFSPEELPFEMLNDLSKEEAKHIADELNNGGFITESKLTTELSELKNRAEDIWYTRYVDDYGFTEVDGLIINLIPANARNNVAYYKGKFPDIKSWEIEASLNHSHIDICIDTPESDDECIEEGEKAVERIISALKVAYPDISFTVSHIPGKLVSFWQTTQDSPKDDCLPIESDECKAWCRNCSGNKEYYKTDYIDARFPKAEWGICKICGARILTKTCKKLVHIGP